MSDLSDNKPVDISVLGPIQVAQGSTPIELGATRLKTLLVLLCIRQGRPVATERLIEEIWEEDPPAGAKSTLQSYVSNLRRSLGSEVIVTSGGGYGLGPEVTLDLTEFEECVGAAQQASSSDNLDAQNRRSIERACEIWRGSFAEDIRPLDRLERYATVVDEKRLMVTALRVGTLVEESPEQAITQLRSLRSEYPTDERFVGLIMKALVALDRRAEALRECHEFRRELVEKTGIGPSVAIQELEHSIVVEETFPPQDFTSDIDATGLATAPADSFVGRQSLFDYVCKRLQSHRLVTLVGPAGVGKSRMAIEVAHYLKSSFGNIIVEDMSDPDAADAVIHNMETVVGKAAQQGKPSRNLIVLENCERMLPRVLSAIDRLLSDRLDVFILATSRARLDMSLEKVVQVPPLATHLPESEPFSTAARLFIDRMESLGATVEERDWLLVERVVSDADGLPFIIELAAQRAAGLGIHIFESGIGLQLSTMSSDKFDESHRQRSVESIISWSLNHLPFELRRLLTALTIFECPFTYGAAEAVGDAVGVNTGSILTKLVDQSLVLKVPDGTSGYRYVVFKTLRVFLREEFAEFDSREDVERAFLRVFAAKASAMAPDVRSMTPDQRVATILPDQPNLLAGLAIARRLGAFKEAVDLLWTFIWHCQELDEAAATSDWIRETLASEACDPVDAMTVARARVSVLAVCFNLGSRGISIAEATEVVECARQVNDDDLLADALSLQGGTAINSNDLETAFAALSEAKDLCHSIGHLWGLAIVDVFRGIAERRAHRLERSYEIGHKALERLDYLGDERGFSFAKQSMARTLQEMGRISEAREYAAEAYSIAAELEDPAASALAALAYGRTAVSAGDLGFGRSLFVKALLSSIKIQNTILLSSSLEWIALIDFRLLGNGGVLAFVDGHTSQFRRDVNRPAHESVLEEAQKSLGTELFDIERRRGLRAPLDTVLDRLNIRH